MRGQAGRMRGGGAGEHGPTVGGLVEHGPELRGAPAAQCELMAAQPPRYASPRAAVEEPPELLLRRAMPGNLMAGTPPPTKPPGATRRVKGADLPTPTTGGEEACDRATEKPAGPIAIWQLYGEGIYQREILSKLEECATAARIVESGGDPPKVATLRITTARQPAWARGDVYDCTDHLDCRVVERSTRHTIFPGRRQVDRVAYRAVAEEVGWREIDQDIVDQAGEGGLEIRSDCARETVIAWHHHGFLAEIDAARAVIDANMDEEWVSEPTMHLQWVPQRVNPRNVLMQERQRVLGDGETIENYLKARVTSNTSYGGAESPNGGVPPEERALGLPTPQTFGVGLAIVRVATNITVPIPGYDGAEDDARGSCQLDGESYEGVGGYAVDATSAYNFFPIQRADHHLQGFFWWRSKAQPDGTRRFQPGVSTSVRAEFGGSSLPNRFCRAMAPVGAYVQQQQRAFDASQPPPPRIRAWSAHRRRLQEQGVIPAGVHHTEPRYLQLFVDDGNGGCDKGKVSPPPEVARLVISPRTTVAMGGVFAPVDSRLYVHAGLYILGITRIGLEESPPKTVIGDPVGSLGFEMAIAAGRIRCTPSRRAIMLADISAQRARATDERRVRCAAALRLTSKLNHVAQIMPGLRPLLHGGYAVSTGRYTQHGRRPQQRIQRELQLAKGSRAQQGWLNLLGRGEEILSSHVDAPLASRETFVQRGMTGVYTVTTDASGVDGVGGFAWVAGSAKALWVVSEKWPRRIQEALNAASTTGEERAALRDARAPMLGMPAAELFGCWVVPAVVAEARGDAQVLAIYSIGDCQPAAAVINSGAGGTPQMRHIATRMTESCELWLGIAVRREENTDADILSHPARRMEVITRAAEAGYQVHEVRIHECDPRWTTLGEAAAMGVGEGYESAEGATKRTHSDLVTGTAGGTSGDARATRTAHGTLGQRLDLFGHDPYATTNHETRGARSVAMVVFSGEDEREAGLPAQLRKQGFDTIVVDTKEGGAAHDVRRSETQHRVMLWLTSGALFFLFMGVPCESFSIAHRPQLRSAKWADGLPNVPEAWRRYMEKHNGIATWACELAMWATKWQVLWAVENPAYRGDKQSPAFWARMRDHGALWRFSAWQRVMQETSPGQVTFAQCSVPDGARVQKYTTIMFSPQLEEGMGGLRLCVCKHAEHDVIAHGRDAAGRGRAELAAAYPAGLSRWIAAAAASARAAAGAGKEHGGRQ